MRITTICALVALVASTYAWHTMHHDEIQTIPEAVAPGHEYLLAIRPLINYKSFQYCAPFPAVNAQGVVGEGLKAVGSTNGKCATSSGQVYARAHTLANGQLGVMYGWYFPKEQDYNGPHTHDWNFIVVWLNIVISKTPSVKAISYLVGTKWTKETKFNSDLGHVYFLKDASGIEPFHEALNPDDDVKFISNAVSQPLIDWNVMPAPARHAMNFFDWGRSSADQVYMNDYHFKIQMQHAWDSAKF